MYKKLNDDEIKIVVKKVREKYRTIITDFKKSNSMLEAFEDRYMRVLKSPIDISVFLLAEIEAVDEIYNNESVKLKEKEAQIAARKRVSRNQTYADKVMQENERRISKYDRVEIGVNADAEIERLMGAVRVLINNYWPAVTTVFKYYSDNAFKNSITEFYHKFMVLFDYKGEIPISKSYKTALLTIPLNNKKVEFERFYIIKETAFLLNDLISFFNNIIKTNVVPLPETKLNLNFEHPEAMKENFSGISYKDAVLKVLDYISNIVSDFRIKDIKREIK